MTDSYQWLYLCITRQLLFFRLRCHYDFCGMNMNNKDYREALAVPWDPLEVRHSKGPLRAPVDQRSEPSELLKGPDGEVYSKWSLYFYES